MTRISLPSLASYLVIAGLTLLVLFKGLMAPALFGMLIFVLSRKIADGLQRRNPLQRGLGETPARITAVGILAAVACVLVAGVVTGAFHFSGAAEYQALLLKLASTVEQLKGLLPAWATSSLPESTPELQKLVAHYLKDHASVIGQASAHGAKVLAEMLICGVIGAMLAVTHSSTSTAPLAVALHRRFSLLNSAFAKIVTAQAKISAVNTGLTAVYLLVALPLCGVHLPYAKTLVLLTFLLGLLPVVGNLLSNSAIVLASLSYSFGVASMSLVFLIAVHKLEYFLNARIVGNEVEASPWELLIAMLVGESLFGMAGVVAAPILYAYLKYELKNAEWL